MGVPGLWRRVDLELSPLLLVEVEEVQVVEHGLEVHHLLAEVSSEIHEQVFLLNEGQCGSFPDLRQVSAKGGFTPLLVGGVEDEVVVEDGLRVESAVEDDLVTVLDGVVEGATFGAVVGLEGVQVETLCVQLVQLV